MKAAQDGAGNWALQRINVIVIRYEALVAEY